MKFKETQFGKIPEHWKISNIGEIAQVVTDYVANGSFASLAENVKYWEEENFAVLIRLVDYKNNFQGGFVYIDEHAYEFLKKSKLYGGEIIISNVGANVGTVFLCPHLDTHMSLAPNAIMVKFNDCDDFYYYWFKSPSGQFMLQSIVTGSAQPKFNKTNFRDLIVPIPPIYEQKKIASILKQIDAKIENNKHINQNLELQMQALFDKMFGAKISNAENYNYQLLTDLITIIDNRGKTPPLESVVTENPIIDVKALSGTSRIINFNNCSKYVSNETYSNWFRSGHPKQNDILISTVGSLGEMKIFFGSKGCIAQNVVGFRTKQISTYYLYQYLKTIKNDLVAYNIGSVQPSIKVTHIIKHPIYIPTHKELDEFDRYAKIMTDTIYQNCLESDNLGKLRDSLLPRLMSGELDVSTLDV